MDANPAFLLEEHQENFVHKTKKISLKREHTDLKEWKSQWILYKFTYCKTNCLHYDY